MRFPFPVLVGDIGGTNARFALLTEPGADLSTPYHSVTHDYPNLEAALCDALGHLPARPRSMIACAAGQVEGRLVNLTNAHWFIDGAAVAEAIGLEQGIILNDFEAQALALPIVEPGWTRSVGETRPHALGAQLVLGPGTGLGAAALLEIGDHHFALASEAGHVDFGPVDAEERALWPHIARTHGRVSAETVLSGSGLIRLHAARLAVRGSHSTLDEATLVRRAQQDPGGEEAATVRMFWLMAARFAGDMALAILATGGVTFSGGVLPRLLDLLDPAAFRASFENKAPFTETLRAINTRILVTEDTVLRGLAAIAVNPERYLLDWRKREWR